MLTKLLNDNPVASILAVIVAIVGGVVCIVNPEGIGAFKEYALALGGASGGLGILGYARSVAGKG